MIVLLKLLPNTVLFYIKLLSLLSSEVEEVIHVVKFIMGGVEMFLEALELEIDLKPLEIADVTFGLFILLGLVAFLSELGEFIDDCTRKDLEDNFLNE